MTEVCICITRWVWQLALLLIYTGASSYMIYMTHAKPENPWYGAVAVPSAVFGVFMWWGFLNYYFF